jgi:Mpv17 / PMP22 family
MHCSNPLFACCGVTRRYYRPPVILFTYTGLFDGLKLSEIGKKIKRDTVTALVGSLAVWPAAHVFGFAFILPEYVTLNFLRPHRDLLR